MSDQRSGPVSDKKPYPQPKEIKLQNIPGGVELTRRWSFKWEDGFIGGMGLFLLIIEIASILSVSSGSPGVVELLILIVGFIMIYYALAHRINSTRFSMVMRSITVRKGPLPGSAAGIIPPATW